MHPTSSPPSYSRLPARRTCPRPGATAGRFGHIPEAALNISLTHGVVCRCQILFDRAPRRLRINILVPLCARDRAMLVGVSLDQARIDRKAFTPDQPAAMHAPTTRSNTLRKMALSPK